jgi:hypothetical protein
MPPGVGYKKTKKKKKKTKTVSDSIRETLGISPRKRKKHIDSQLKKKRKLMASR